MTEVTRTTTHPVAFVNTVTFNRESQYIDPSWFRWVMASINTHFTNYRGIYPLYLEGDERTQQDEHDFAELRVDGPLIKMPQHGIFLLDYDINILVQSHIDPDKLYTPHTVLGNFAQAFTSIPVFKFGGEAVDDGSYFGCLEVHHTKYSANRGLEVNQFGIVRQDTRLIQMSVEEHYRLEIVK